MLDGCLDPEILHSWDPAQLHPPKSEPHPRRSPVAQFLRREDAPNELHGNGMK
jgi:hypothetical protein